MPALGETLALVHVEDAAQLIDERRRHREEIAALQGALAIAHGELLELRRKPAERPAVSTVAGRGPEDV